MIVELNCIAATEDSEKSHFRREPGSGFQKRSVNKCNGRQEHKALVFD